MAGRVVLLTGGPEFAMLPLTGLDVIDRSFGPPSICLSSVVAPRHHLPPAGPLHTPKSASMRGRKVQRRLLLRHNRRHKITRANMLTSFPPVYIARIAALISSRISPTPSQDFIFCKLSSTTHHHKPHNNVLRPRQHSVRP